MIDEITSRPGMIRAKFRVETMTSSGMRSHRWG